MTYTVTDTNGDSANATFTVTVNAGLALTAPANQNYTEDTAISNLGSDRRHGDSYADGSDL